MAGLYGDTGSRYLVAGAVVRNPRDLMTVGRLVSRLNRCGSIPRPVEFPRPGLELAAHQRKVIGIRIGTNRRRGHFLPSGGRLAEDRFAMGVECRPDVRSWNCRPVTTVGTGECRAWKSTAEPGRLWHLPQVGDLMFHLSVRSVVVAANRSGPSTGQVSLNRQVVGVIVVQEWNVMSDVMFYRARKPGDRPP